MTRQRISFRDLLQPVTAEDFLDQYYDRKPLHVSGEDSRFNEIFSWPRANDLLNMLTLWSAGTMKVVMDGRTVAPEEFCDMRPSRDGAIMPQPNRRRVQAMLRDGATIVLGFIEMMTPEIASVAAALECLLRAESTCNMYYSWGGHQGFNSHFDPQDVFVLQIEGNKLWRIYEGRYDQTVDVEGYRTNSYPDSYHEQARGDVLREVRMTRGDVLYIPRGQYHDALADREDSLHLTFGVEHLSGFHFLSAVNDSMLKDPLVRRVLPRSGDPKANHAHFRELADHVHAYMVRPETSHDIRARQRMRTFDYCFPTYAIPDHEPNQIIRVCSLRTRFIRRDSGWWLERPEGRIEIPADEAPLVEWLLKRDYFITEEVIEDFSENDQTALIATLQRFATIELIEEI